MRKLKAFSKIDLLVVVGLILVLFGASLTMVGKTIKSINDDNRLKAASTAFDYIQKYHDSNFNIYPLPESVEDTKSYNFVVLSSFDANFLKINLGTKFSNFVSKNEFASDLVYVYKSDGSEAAIVVRKLEEQKDKCNISSKDAPQIIQEYLLRDPSSCYYRIK
jgi:hypothetical protein